MARYAPWYCKVPDVSFVSLSDAMRHSSSAEVR